MHYYIYGPPAAGKSTIASNLALILNRPFYDLDAEIEARVGKTIPEIFSEEQEVGFRAREYEMLAEIAGYPDSVVALGGGALLSDVNRRIVEKSGRIVCLSADIQSLIEHLEHAERDNEQILRPLLAKDRERDLRHLMENRKAHYASFPNQLEVSRLSVQEAVYKAQILLGAFHVTGMGAGYDVIVQNGALNIPGVELKKRSMFGPVALVSDNNVFNHYGQQLMASLSGNGYSCSFKSLHPGEKTKTISSTSELWDFFLNSGIERRSTVIALGGGVVGDLTGFAASTFLRGIQWVNIPTSLLAMVDASIGGKTGANLPQGKNLIGSFHAPGLVIVDPEVLSTLPPEELRSGMAEVIKHAVIADPILFELVSQPWETISQNWFPIISRAIAVKVNVIMTDPYESGSRELLNLGHTIGHAIEKVSSYQVRHGEAVAIGMVAEAKIAERIGIARKGLSKTLEQCLVNIGLPTEIPAHLSKEQIITTLQFDKKKSAGRINYSLPIDIGNVKYGFEVGSLDGLI